MSKGNQSWADDVTVLSTAYDPVADWSMFLGDRRFQPESEVAIGVPAPAATGERDWVMVRHLAADAEAWAQGNSIQRSATAVNLWDGRLTAAAAPSKLDVLGLSQVAWAASTLIYGFIGRNGAFEALGDGTLDDGENAVATNNSGNGHVAGVAVTASIGSHIGFNLEDGTVADEALGTIWLELG